MSSLNPAGLTNSYVLKVQNLTVQFPGASSPVLDSLNLEVLLTEAIGIIGPSGSGKTTLAKAILGSLPAAAKQTGLIQHNPKRPNELAGTSKSFRPGSDVSLLAQEPWSSLNPAMSIKAQFRQAILAHHPTLTRQEVLAKTVSSLREVGLDLSEERLKHYPKEFSGGQQQRICVALSLLHEPRLLIADEPTSSLDAVARSGVLDLLFERQRALGTSLILISHDTDEVFERCSKVFELVQGRLEPVSKTQRVMANSPKRISAARGDLVLVAKDLGFSRKAKRKDQSVFEGLSFELHEGERLGISGDSGAGKTTLARVLAGLEKPSSGELAVLGKDLFRQKFSLEDRSKLAMVFQDSSLSLNPKMTVGQILLEPLRSHGIRLTKQSAKARVERALAEMGLESSLSESYPRFLSGGQRQRVNIARALMLEPRLLIADEPASSLDRENALMILNLIDSLQESKGFALVLISHDQKLIDRYTDRVLEVSPSTNLLPKL